MMTDQVTEEHVDAPQVDPAVLSEAADGGWVPQDKWKGNPEEWIDAETFVRKGKQIQVVLNKKLESERRKSAKLEQDLNELKQTVGGLAEYRAKLEQTIYNQAMKDLKAQLRQAREVGDDAAAAALEEQVDDLKDNPPKVDTKPTPAPQGGAMHPDVVSWMEANPWYSDSNPEMKEYAEGATMSAINQAKAQGVQLNIKDMLAGVTAKVKKMFPNQFSTGNNTPMFEGGGRGSSSQGGGGKGYASLPPDAKKEFERFWKSDYYRGLTKEQAQVEYHKVYTEG